MINKRIFFSFKVYAFLESQKKICKWILLTDYCYLKLGKLFKNIEYFISNFLKIWATYNWKIIKKNVTLSLNMKII